MRNDDVVAKLRSVSSRGYPIKLVIARKIKEDPDDVHISDVHVSLELRQREKEGERMSEVEVERGERERIRERVSEVER